MDPATGEIVVLTGSSGFLGRHLLGQLVEDEHVAEVRAVDRVAVCEATQTSPKLRHYSRDLLDLEACREAFRGADVVLHCAGLVSYGYPPEPTELWQNNVDATENVVRLCTEEGIDRLVHCSTTEVTLQPSSWVGFGALVIYKSESKLALTEKPRRLMFGAYAASKLEAERIVLRADKRPLGSGGVLRTVALRPTLLYGEGDPHLLPEILRFAKSRGDSLPRLASDAGKQQITYVGNAAWAFIRAKDTLRERPEAIGGLPVAVTDDTPIEDLTCVCERLTRAGPNRLRLSSWSVPAAVSYLGALILELLCDFGVISRFKISPRAMIAYLSSVIIYSRARASIHMNYWPKYYNEKTLALASKYYGDIYSKKC